MTGQPFLDRRIQAVAEAFPSRPALFDHAAGLVSYASLETSVAEAASRLQALGVGPGQPVLLVSANSVGFVVAYFAVLRAGGVAVPFGAGTMAARLRQAKAATQARLAIADGAAAATLAAACPDLAQATALAHGMTVLGRGDGGPADHANERRPDDLAYIIHSSGTTGEPKGVMMSHRAAATWIDRIAKAIGYDGSQREATILSLAHSYALGQLQCVLFSGGFAWIQDGLRAPQSLFDGIIGQNLNSLTATPSLLRLLIDKTGPAFAPAAGRLGLVLTNSEPMPRPLAERLFALAPDARLVMFYGLTEAPRALAAVVGADLADWAGDVGRPFDGGEVEIRDPEGVPLPVGDVGEVHLRGANLCRGYLGRPDLTGAAIRDGWLRTGDWGRLDATGRLTLMGRLSDAINVGGIKVSPQEVEAALAADAMVRDVAAVGIDDPLGITGERVGLLVVAADGVDEAAIRKLCGQLLEPTMRPAVVRLIDRIPRAPGGKIRRDEVRRQLS